MHDDAHDRPAGSRNRIDRRRLAVAVPAGLLGAVAGLFWSRCVFVVLRSRISDDPRADPHGYGLIFGSVFALPAAAILIVALSFVVPPGRSRTRVARIVAPPVFGASLLLLVALVTA